MKKRKYRMLFSLQWVQADEGPEKELIKRRCCDETP
jgi:hypothetical protein